MRRLATPLSAITRHLLALVNTQKVSNGRSGIREMCAAAGVSYNVVHSWKYGHDPKLSDAEAVANECGKTLVFMDLDTPPK